MLSTTSLAAKLRADFPQFIFSPSEDFHWSPLDMTVFYNQDSKDASSLLHELSHALLGHTDYNRDVILIKMEREAWEYAQKILAPSYSVTITIDEIENSIDTYRDWLHARSTCPECLAAGLQVTSHKYKCVVCYAKWRVNDARSCALRRSKI